MKITIPDFTNLYRAGILLFALMIFNQGVAQSPSVLWMQSYGNNIGASVQQTYDGGYILTGDIWFGAGNQDALIIKTNAQGDSLWKRTFEGGIYGAYSGGTDIKQLADSGYLMSGFLYGDAYLIRLDERGDTVWTRSFRSPGSYYSGAAAVTLDGDSAFVITGWANYYGFGDQVFIGKIDTGGTVKWMKDYGAGPNDGGADIIKLTSGGYAVLGTTASYGAGGSDIYLLRTNENGDTLWTRPYGGVRDDWGRKVLETANGGFILLGNSRSFFPGTSYPYSDAYVIRCNSKGDTLWTRLYSFWEGNDDVMNSISPTADSGYVMVGNTFDRVWAIKIDSTGNPLWKATYDIGTNEFGTDILEATDNSFIITGGVKFGPSAAPYNAFLLKLGTPTAIEDRPANAPKQFQLYQNYPNPFNPSTNIQFQISESGFVRLTIYDISGREIKTLVNKKLSPGEYTVEWNGRNRAGERVASGVYFYRLQTDDFRQTRKMLLVR